MESPDPELPDTHYFKQFFSKFPSPYFGFTGISQRPAGRYFGLMGICNGRRSRFSALRGERDIVLRAICTCIKLTLRSQGPSSSIRRDAKMEYLAIILTREMHGKEP